MNAKAEMDSSNVFREKIPANIGVLAISVP